METRRNATERHGFPSLCLLYALPARLAPNSVHQLHYTVTGQSSSSMDTSFAFSASHIHRSLPAAVDARDLTNNPDASVANDTPFDLSTIDLDLETDHITGPMPESLRDIPVASPAVHFDRRAMAPFPTAPSVLHEKMAKSSSSSASIHSLVEKLRAVSPYTADTIVKGLQDLLDCPALIEALHRFRSLPVAQVMYVLRRI